MRTHDPSRRALLAWCGTAVLLPGTTGCAAPPSVLPARAATAMAPSGRLRAAINVGNPILASSSGAGQAVGVSVDLARALAAQLGVALELIVFDAAARSVDAVKSGQADIGFFAVDPLRSDGIRFSAPYLLIEGCYLVRQASPIVDNAQVDRPGTRVMVGQGSAYDLYLSRALQAAQIVRTPTSPGVVDAFLAQNADVAAGVRQQLQADAQRIAGLRLLPGNFMVIEQAMGLPAGRGDAAGQALRGFVEWAKRSGLVAQALQRHGIAGATVAPPV